MLKKKNLSGSFEDRAIFHVIHLSYDGGGGGLKVSPLFLFVKPIEKVIRLCTVLIFF